MRAVGVGRAGVQVCGHWVCLCVWPAPALLSPATNGQPGVQLQRGDLVFVPSSRIGNAIQRVDMYVGQLLMFRGFGASANYQINEPSYRINTPEVTVP